MTKRIVMAAMVLAVLLAGLTAITAQKVLAGSTSDTVLLVHGFNVNSVISCDNNSEFGTIKTFLTNNGISSNISLGFYNADNYCDNYISSGESYHCTGWYDSGSNDGTVNEDIRHTSCLLAWFIYDQYTSHGRSVEIIAHSMGGILIRQAMNDTTWVSQFPPHLYISDVVTAATPQQGLMTGAAGVMESAGAAWFSGAQCPGNCTEVYQMQADNAMMANLNSTGFRNGWGRDPQGYYGTDWTTMGSNNDTQVAQYCVSGARLGAPSQVNNLGLCGLMPGATHFVVYQGPSPSYNHGDYLTDNNTYWTADECYSDNNGGTWYCVNNSEHSIYTMYRGIISSGW